jgi:hypothetical protein
VPVTVTHFYDANGRDIGSVPEAIDLEQLSSPVISAGRVSIATMIQVNSSDQRPEAGHIHVEALPLVAWRVTRHGASPVFARQPASDGALFLAANGGQLVGTSDGFGQAYSSVDRARDAVLQAAQAAWDVNHPEAQAVVEAEPAPKAAAGRRR